MSLTPEETRRYARHISLENVGREGQEKLIAAKVLVIGAGGLGCPILQYLTAAGIGTIGVIDDDVVDESNLQRQVLYTVADVGTPKVEAAINRLSGQNPFVTFIPFQTRLSTDNALKIFSDFDIIIDGTDNFPTRYLVNDACIIADKPLVYGSIFKFEGQVSVFNYQNGPSYRCLYPEPPSSDQVPNCSEVGVIGVLPGVIGTRMATECIKMILGIGSTLSGKIELVDLLNFNSFTLKIARVEDNFNRTTFEASYKEFCGIETVKMGKEIVPIALKSRIENGEQIQIIDVREDYELDICKIEGSIHIPLGEIPTRMNEISKNDPVVMVCHHGIRSANAIYFLEAQGFLNLTNLEGGIHAWAAQVDDEMMTY